MNWWQVIGETNTQNSLSIVAILPKPEGDETIAEAIMIANYSTSPINLKGWQLSDRAQTTWNLDELGSAIRSCWNRLRTL